MREELNQCNLENRKKTIQSWLCEISLLDGKCCYKSKVSELRAKLVTNIDISQSHSIEILRKFDEKLWRNEGHIYEINSEELIKLQNDISRLNINNVHDEKKRFNLKKEIFIFTLNQSTLLAFAIAIIIFTKNIFDTYNYINCLGVGFGIGFLIVISLVTYIFKGWKGNYIIWLSFLAILFLLFFYIDFLYSQKNIVYVSKEAFFSLFFQMLIDFVMFGFYFFSSLYGLSVFVDNKINTPGLVIFIVTIVFYGCLILAVLQGIGAVI
ncbi:TPA: hypothetical protein OMQ51_001255 [Acinetobacter baumannii]|nr:hypothetical protein [Acinetobacter baumannii]